MGQQIPISTSFNLPDGREVTIETGKLASLADGSVVVRMGNTMLFAVVVSAREAREGIDFFPLSVDYQEKFAAIGRIPGNFFRREARLSDNEVLICRLVDRAIRPLFPKGYQNETQIQINLISGDKETMPDAMAALAASAALAVSDIPFEGPISEVRVARVDGAFQINPNKSDSDRADINLIVAATMDDVMMVEGEANECQEHEIVEAIKLAHDAIKVQIQAQLDLAKKVGEKVLVKREFTPPAPNEDLVKIVEEHCSNAILAVGMSASDKQTRATNFKEIRTAMLEALLESHGEEFMAEHTAELKTIFDKLKKEVIRKMVLDTGKRLDGRKLEEIRSIWTEIDYLPSAHGSAIFTRGETQSLTSVTLGTKLDEMMLDNALDFKFERFILHYNFPAYSVGEVRPSRGPGRREVGHANLAARSLRKVMPTPFPYTVRIVSDILESNGSSSMATVCAGSLAMMDAGIPLKKAVSGIAMGMISDGERFSILSDILGDEDALGDMDFKLTGTRDGITACQMDIKINGLPYELLEKALLQAKEGRMHILNEMSKTIADPREDFKPHAPRIVEIIIDKSFIGAVIGPGGKIIQDIQEKTGAIINITEEGDKGIVNIASSDLASIEAARKRIYDITFSPEVGDVFDSVVKTVMPYGVFVDFKGKSGLLHVSEISYQRIENVEDYFKEGDEVKVKVVEIDSKTGKIRLSAKALLPRPEGYQEREERPRERRDDNRGGGGDRDRRPPRRN
jgi:polyribonucleotide nucleotidyltransferase